MAKEADKKLNLNHQSTKKTKQRKKTRDDKHGGAAKSSL